MSNLPTEILTKRRTTLLAEIATLQGRVAELDYLLGLSGDRVVGKPISPTVIEVSPVTEFVTGIIVKARNPRKLKKA